MNVGDGIDAAIREVAEYAEMVAPGITDGIGLDDPYLKIPSSVFYAIAEAIGAAEKAAADFVDNVARLNTPIAGSWISPKAAKKYRDSFNDLVKEFDRTVSSTQGGQLMANNAGTATTTAKVQGFSTVLMLAWGVYQIMTMELVYPGAILGLPVLKRIAQAGIGKAITELTAALGREVVFEPAGNLGRWLTDHGLSMLGKSLAEGAGKHLGEDAVKIGVRQAAANFLRVGGKLGVDVTTDLAKFVGERFSFRGMAARVIAHREGDSYAKKLLADAVQGQVKRSLAKRIGQRIARKGVKAARRELARGEAYERLRQESVRYSLKELGSGWKREAIGAAWKFPAFMGVQNGVATLIELPHHPQLDLASTGVGLASQAVIGAVGGPMADILGHGFGSVVGMGLGTGVVLAAQSPFEDVNLVQGEVQAVGFGALMAVQHGPGEVFGFLRARRLGAVLGHDGGGETGGAPEPGGSPAPDPAGGAGFVGVRPARGDVAETFGGRPAVHPAMAVQRRLTLRGMGARRIAERESAAFAKQHLENGVAGQIGRHPVGASGRGADGSAAPEPRTTVGVNALPRDGHEPQLDLVRLDGHATAIGAPGGPIAGHAIADGAKTRVRPIDRSGNGGEPGSTGGGSGAMGDESNSADGPINLRSVIHQSTHVSIRADEPTHAGVMARVASHEAGQHVERPVEHKVLAGAGAAVSGNGHQSRWRVEGHSQGGAGSDGAVDHTPVSGHRPGAGAGTHGEVPASGRGESGTGGPAREHAHAGDGGSGPEHSQDRPDHQLPLVDSDDEAYRLMKASLSRTHPKGFLSKTSRSHHGYSLSKDEKLNKAEEAEPVKEGQIRIFARADPDGTVRIGDSYEEGVVVDGKYQLGRPLSGKRVTREQYLFGVRKLVRKNLIDLPPKCEVILVSDYFGRGEDPLAATFAKTTRLVTSAPSDGLELHASGEKPVAGGKDSVASGEESIELHGAGRRRTFWPDGSEFLDEDPGPPRYGRDLPRHAYDWVKMEWTDLRGHKELGPGMRDQLTTQLSWIKLLIEEVEATDHRAVWRSTTNGTPPSRPLDHVVDALRALKEAVNDYVTIRYGVRPLMPVKVPDSVDWLETAKLVGRLNFNARRLDPLDEAIMVAEIGDLGKEFGELAQSAMPRVMLRDWESLVKRLGPLHADAVDKSVNRLPLGEGYVEHSQVIVIDQGKGRTDGDLAGSLVYSLVAMIQPDWGFVVDAVYGADPDRGPELLRQIAVEHYYQRLVVTRLFWQGMRGHRPNLESWWRVPDADGSQSFAAASLHDLEVLAKELAKEFVLSDGRSHTSVGSVDFQGAPLSERAELDPDHIFGLAKRAAAEAVAGRPGGLYSPTLQKFAAAHNLPLDDWRSERAARADPEVAEFDRDTGALIGDRPSWWDSGAGAPSERPPAREGHSSDPDESMIELAVEEFTKSRGATAALVSSALDGDATALVSLALDGGAARAMRPARVAAAAEQFMKRGDATALLSLAARADAKEMLRHGPLHRPRDGGPQIAWRRRDVRLARLRRFMTQGDATPALALALRQVVAQRDVTPAPLARDGGVAAAMKRGRVAAAVEPVGKLGDPTAGSLAAGGDGVGAAVEPVAKPLDLSLVSLADGDGDGDAGTTAIERTTERDDATASIAEAEPPSADEQPTSFVPFVNVHHPRLRIPYAQRIARMRVRYDRPRTENGRVVPLFNGITGREDGAQGALCDCGCIAGIGALADLLPDDIVSLLWEHPDGWVEARPYEVEVVFDKSHPYGGAIPTGRRHSLMLSPEVPVLGTKPVVSKYPNQTIIPGTERVASAYADQTINGTSYVSYLEKMLAGIDQTWPRVRRANAPALGYERLNAGTTALDRAVILAQLSGRPAVVRRLDKIGDDAAVEAELRTQIDNHKPVLVDVPAGKNVPYSLFGWHVYDVVSLSMVRLHNPWGMSNMHPKPMSIRELRKGVAPEYTTLE